MLNTITRKYLVTAGIGMGALLLGLFSGFLLFSSDRPKEIAGDVELSAADFKEDSRVISGALEREDLTEAPITEEAEPLAAETFEDLTRYEEQGETSYVIGVFEGRVAVFIVTEEGASLSRLTEKPVTALAENERERLEMGVTAYGDAELIRLLEDYDS